MAGGSYQAVTGNFPAHLIEATSQRGNNRVARRDHTLTLKLQFLERLLLSNTRPWSQESPAKAANHLYSWVSRRRVLDLWQITESVSHVPYELGCVRSVARLSVPFSHSSCSWLHLLQSPEMFKWADWVETCLVYCKILYRPAALFFLLTFGFLQLRACWGIRTMVPNIILASESKTEVCIKTKLTDNCVLDLRKNH